MMRLILIRHGQTDWNVEGRYQGQADPPLNDVGRKQANATADQLASLPIEAIYTSTLKRALETAKIIARQHTGLAVTQDERLREINLGAWEGMLSRDIPADYPDAWAMRQQDPVHSRAPGGESIAEVAKRVWAAADEIACHHPQGLVVIVSHTLALATLVCKASDQPLDMAYHMASANASHTEIEWPCDPKIDNSREEQLNVP